MSDWDDLLNNGYRWPPKIRKFGIKDPCQMFIVAKYENLIDWNGAKIQSPEALVEHISDKMLPDLMRRLDPNDRKSHYCRSINLTRMLESPAPHMDKPRRIYKNKGEDAARKFLVEEINGQKKEAFDKWLLYMTAENPVYAENPAFQYIVLRPVIESSGKKNTRSCVPLDAEAVAHVYDGIMGGKIQPNQNILQKFCEYMAFGDSGRETPRFGSECEWHRVERHRPKAARRVAMLSTKSGWCTASERMAASYLRRSDFNILLESGRPVVAVRTDGSHVLEIRGRKNSDPGDWWPRISLFICARVLDLDRNHNIQCRERDVSKQYCERLSRIGSAEELRKHLEKHPAQVIFLREEIANAPENRPAIQTAWLSCAGADPRCAKLAPDWLRDTKGMQRLWAVGKIQEFEERLISDVAAWHECPQELRRLPEIAKARIEGWQRRLFIDPLKGDECPQKLCKLPAIKAARLEGWRNRIARYPRSYANCPPDLREDPQIIRSASRKWVERILWDPLIWEKCPEKLKEVDLIQDAHLEGWKSLVTVDPSRFNDAPAEMCELLQGSVVKQWKSIPFTRDLDWSDWMNCPDFVKCDYSIARKAEIPITRALRSDPTIWKKLVSPWNERDDLRKEAAECWAFSPNCFNKAPPRDIAGLVAELRED